MNAQYTAVLEAIKAAAQDNDNYTPVFKIAAALGGIGKTDLWEALNLLESRDLISIKSLVHSSKYTASELAYGYQTRSGSPRFFIVLDNCQAVTVEEVAQATTQTEDSQANVDTSTEERQMKTAIETLIEAIEIQANSSVPVYRKMQSLLKEARDQHSIELKVVLNKPTKVLHTECQRVVTEFKAGTIGHKTTEVKQEKTKKAKATTTTSATAEQPATESKPKQPAFELLYTEAQQEIERLRRELADKTNEVAEYAEALSHAQATIKKQQETIDQLKTTETKVEAAPATTVEATVEETEDEWCDDEEDATDAVDDMMGLLMEGYQEVLHEMIVMVQKKLGKTRAEQFTDALDNIEFLDFDNYGAAFRNLMRTYSIKLEWVEQAVSSVS